MFIKPLGANTRPLQNYRDFCRRFPVTSVKYGTIIILCNIPEDLVVSFSTYTTYCKEEILYGYTISISHRISIIFSTRNFVNELVHIFFYANLLNYITVIRGVVIILKVLYYTRC